MPLRKVLYSKRQPYIPLDVSIALDEVRKPLKFSSTSLQKPLVVLAFHAMVTLNLVHVLSNNTYANMH